MMISSVKCIIWFKGRLMGSSNPRGHEDTEVLLFFGYELWEIVQVRILKWNWPAHYFKEEIKKKAKVKQNDDTLLPF